MKRLVIVEDQTAIREMLVEILRLDPNYSLVGEAGDGQPRFSSCSMPSPTSSCSMPDSRLERR